VKSCDGAVTAIDGVGNYQREKGTAYARSESILSALMKPVEMSSLLWERYLTWTASLPERQPNSRTTGDSPRILLFGVEHRNHPTIRFTAFLQRWRYRFTQRDTFCSCVRRDMRYGAAAEQSKSVRP
jgi:hypothetical protein